MQTSLRTFREDKREGRGNLDPLQFVEGVLATNLAAATGASGKDANQSLTGHTTATLNIIAWDETDNYYLTGQTQEITNRSPNFSAGVGTYLSAYHIGGEYRPLPTFQTVRGRLVRDLENDDAVGWPKTALMEVLGIGRLFGITDASSSSAESVVTAVTATPEFIVTGDITAEATVDRILRVTGCGAADGDYTIVSSSYSAPSTTINVSGAVAAPTLDGDSSAMVLGEIVIDGVPQSASLNVSADVTDLIHVGDTLSLWGLTGTYTVAKRVYDSGTRLTTITMANAIDASTITVELTTTTITAQTGTTVTATGNVRPEAVTGHVINITNTGAANGRYTIFNAVLSAGNTVITHNEAASLGTVGGSSAITILRSLLQHTIHPDARLIYTISSMTTGANGTVTIPDPDETLLFDDPICACDMFLEGHTVIIEGSTGGVNDGEYKCRRDFLDNGATITIYLDGTLAAAATPGTITLKVPPPIIAVSKALAVFRWYRAELLAGSIVHTLPPDGDGFHDIIASDLGPSTPPVPDP